MSLLNILQHSDGSFAWENILIIIIAGIAGYLLKSRSAAKTQQAKNAALVSERDAKYKKLDNEFKQYKASITSGDKHHEKTIAELSGRVKSLEGDIRILSEEKNRLTHQLSDKEQESRNLAKQLTDFEDRFKSLQEEKIKSETDWRTKLKEVQNNLTRATAWEQRVRSAEEDAQKSKNALANAERKKLEAELRLKATAEYAGKVVPLESALQEWKNKYDSLLQQLQQHLQEEALRIAESSRTAEALDRAGEENKGLRATVAQKEQQLAGLEEKLSHSEDMLSNFQAVSAHLELVNQSSAMLQQELNAKNESMVALHEQIETLKNNPPHADPPAKAPATEENNLPPAE